MSNKVNQSNNSNFDEEKELEKLRKENANLTKKVFYVLKDLFTEIDKKKKTKVIDLEVNK